MTGQTPNRSVFFLGGRAQGKKKATSKGNKYIERNKIKVIEKTSVTSRGIRITFMGQPSFWLG